MIAATLYRHVPPATTSRPVGVLFAEDFDTPGLVVLHEESVDGLQVAALEPTVDIEAVRHEAFNQGREHAMAQLDAALENHAETSRQLLERVAVALNDAARESARVAEAGAEAVARLLLGMLAAVLPALCARHGAAEVAALTRSILPALAHAPRVSIRVSADALETLRAEVLRLDPELRARVEVTTSDAVPPGDVRIAWQDGCASRETARLWQAIGEALAPIGLLDAMPSGEASCDANQ